MIQIIIKICLLIIINQYTLASADDDKNYLLTPNYHRGPTPITSSLDSRLVVFPYNANTSFTIYSRVGVITNLSLAPGEKVRGLYLSDSLRWVHAISDDRSDVFLKPVEKSLLNPATLVTNMRKYQLLLVSVSENDEWYQRVSWHVTNELISYESKDIADKNEIINETIHKKNSINNESFQPEDLFFSYEISGHKDIKPDKVFDNKKYTWIIMPPNAKNYPVIFSITPSGKLKIVNYQLNNLTYQLDQVYDQLLLKSGTQEVTITRTINPSRHHDKNDPCINDRSNCL